MIAFAVSDVQFGIDEYSPYFIYDRVLPQQIQTTLLAYPGVLNMSNEDNNTQVWFNQTYMENNGITMEVLRKYLESIDYVLERNDKQVVTFPGFPIPDCNWDYGTNQVVGVYYYNGEQFILQNDPNC